ncbi:MAG TPA: hypothetical protein VMG12_16180 [Polyangiaceae bacterium]|nr:hypothetical protein [Polyangiaceae bacterium]
MNHNDSLRLPPEFCSLLTSSLEITNNPQLEQLPSMQGFVGGRFRTNPEYTDLASRVRIAISHNDVRTMTGNAPASP